jgi:hypothetical protein
VRRLLVALAAAAFAVPSLAVAAGTARMFFEDTVPRAGSTAVTVTTQRAAAFRVVLRVPIQGRARLYLTGKTAPRGGPLIDTCTYACEGAAGSFYCRASYEPLPKGRYTWRITWRGARRAHVELTVRW